MSLIYAFILLLPVHFKHKTIICSCKHVLVHMYQLYSERHSYFVGSSVTVVCGMCGGVIGVVLVAKCTFFSFCCACCYVTFYMNVCIFMPTFTTLFLYFNTVQQKTDRRENKRTCRRK